MSICVVLAIMLCCQSTVCCSPAKFALVGCGLATPWYRGIFLYYTVICRAEMRLIVDWGHLE